MKLSIEEIRDLAKKLASVDEHDIAALASLAGNLWISEGVSILSQELLELVDDIQEDPTFSTVNILGLGFMLAIVLINKKEPTTH